MALREVLTSWPVVASVTTMSEMAKVFQGKDHCGHLLATMAWRRADLPHLRLLPLHHTAGSSVQAVWHEIRRTKIREIDLISRIAVWFIVPALNQERILRWPLPDTFKTNLLSAPKDL
jgi:hypothetical protein